MPIGFTALTEVSVIALLDGPGCEHESFMGYWGLLIWITLTLYLMAGQFVICEEYFVPILAQLGDRWKMAEDVQGATLLAVGSSSPELFTALLGAIFYPDDNPGPGTNVGSAVFNLCIIVGLSAIFAPRTAKLQIVPFLRDSIAYMFGLIQLFAFYSIITPGEMDIWESIALIGWWIFYIFIVYRTDLLHARCCCCIPEHNVDGHIKNAVELEKVPDVDIEQQTETNDDPHSRHKQSAPLPDFAQNPDNIHIAPGTNAIDDDLQHLLEELNRKQRENVNKGWIVVVMPSHHQQKPKNNVINNDEDDRRSHAHTYVRRRTLMETIKHERDERESRHHLEHGSNGHDDDGHEEEHGHGAALLHKFLKPWTKLFSCTLPAPEGAFVSKHIYLSIMAIVAWLGLLTFFVVDCSEKIGECFNIPGGLLGITLLAVGSSLPDCISSIIVARQMKIDMAVANAFGSNIFDVNLCVGFGFLLGSFAKMGEGESTSIFLGDGHALETFSELIIAAAGFMVFLWIMMWCTVFRLERWIGYVLSVSYVGYICVFTVLFVHADDAEAEMAES